VLADETEQIVEPTAYAVAGNARRDAVLAVVKHTNDAHRWVDDTPQVLGQAAAVLAGTDEHKFACQPPAALPVPDLMPEQEPHRE
jgi:hypothetical protein